jgi:signal transduction histidine kinase
VKPHRITLLVVTVGFAATLGGYLAHQFPWVSLLIGLTATVAVAGLLDLAVSRRDEALQLVGELEVKNAQLDDALSARAHAEQGLRQAQRMEVVGQLAGGIAHDFNNLLQAILSYSEFLADGLDAESDLQRDVAEVQKAARRAAGLTRQLLVFSRQHAAEPAIVDLNASIHRMEHLLRVTVGDEVQLNCHTPEAPSLVLADAGELELMLMNLSVNARDAMPDGGTLTITVDLVEIDGPTPSLRPGRFVRIQVADDGEGMTPETAAKAFEPFFTTKETGRGAGLGLAMVYGIASRSGGNASISTLEGSGTTISVIFPLADQAPGSESGGELTVGQHQADPRRLASSLPVAP